VFSTTFLHVLSAKCKYLCAVEGGAGSEDGGGREPFFFSYLFPFHIYETQGVTPTLPPLWHFYG